jgi:DNA-binding CsgD family transcriptional regulator
MSYVRPRSTRPVRSFGDPAKVYRVRKARGTLARTTADRARTHVLDLLALGLTPEAIARSAGISRGVIDRLAADEQRLIDRRIEAAILTVSWRPHPRQAVCLAIGARRRARALARIGWPLTWQGEQIGIQGTNYASQIAKTRISYRTWAAIRDLYEQLQMTPGPSTKAARVAELNGWPAPLEWDDVAIDDPTAGPAAPEHASDDLDPVVVQRLLDGFDVRATRAERAEAIRQLASRGLSDADIAARVRVTVRTVLRIRADHDIPTGWEAA